MKYNADDIIRTRLVMLDEIIDECVRAGSAKDLHPVDRVVALQLSQDLERIRHQGFDADYRAAQAVRMKNSILKAKDNE